MKTVILLYSFLSLTHFCFSADRASQLDDIREATFRYQFIKNASGLGQKAKVYFLSIYDPVNNRRCDPAEKFIQRFTDHKPRVAKVSESKSADEDGVRDKGTGEQGLIFVVGEIHWVSDETVEVAGGYYEGFESASGNTYYLKMKKGKWIVERDVMHTISLIGPKEPSPVATAQHLKSHNRISRAPLPFSKSVRAA